MTLPPITLYQNKRTVKKMKFVDFLKNYNVCLDGGMGTLLQELGLRPGEKPECWNLTRPEVITDIHRQYYDAGSNVVSTNTFGANLLKFSEGELEEIICAAVKCAATARETSTSEKEKYIALDIGPTGRLLKPLGDLDFEAAVSVFAKTVKLGVKYGVDLVIVETMNDSYETKAALLAVKENSDLPVIVTNAYGEDGKLMTGATPEAMVALLEGLGADAIGANCSLGPRALRPVAEDLISHASVPVVIKPNAGIPHTEGERTVFDVSAEEFACELSQLVKMGVRVFGGCCGTTPEYISRLTEKLKDLSPVPILEKNTTLVSSYTHAVRFDKHPILIGERINPTGKKRFKQALLEKDLDYVLSEGVNQEEKGVHILDVNVGLPEVDEASLLPLVVSELQAVTDLPLQIDSSDPVAMEAALRLYNGKAMINSVNGKEESMNAVFPLVKKYGGVVVALTLDDNGIAADSDSRVEIAEKILDRAAKYGIKKKDIIFDTLAMTVSADDNSALVTLDALHRIRSLGCHTSLGVSNVSFGLPSRDSINSTFFVMALENGLSAAIMNPYSAEMMKAYHTYLALKGLDPACAGYISAAHNFVTATVSPQGVKTSNAVPISTLKDAIIKGFKEKARSIASELLVDTPPLELIENEIIPALNTVGEGFEAHRVYLPELLMSAEAAKCAFESVRAVMSDSLAKEGRATFVLATVKGDIHDIGKNIVKLLLQNYGFTVVDLGKDVSPEEIVKAAVCENADFVGLSALMTTTVPAMEKSIKMLRDAAPCCKIIVGGAVLTADYAAKIGADKYAPDAMEAVRYAESVIKAKNLNCQK